LTASCVTPDGEDRRNPERARGYKAFKQYARSLKVAAAGVEALVADIRALAGYYCAMALGSEPDADLKAAFHDIRELKVDVAFPFLLDLYTDFAAQVLTKAELLQAARWIESYVFRRAVCGIPTNSMNKTFATFARALKKDRYLESVQAHFLLLPSYRRFSTDDEFQRELQIKDLYNFRSRSYWLRRTENHDRKERVPVDEYTIEHILPQNENLSAQWKADLGPEWERIQKTWLHTLGNLTLTGYNPELSDRPFTDKRDMKGGFAESPLRMNQGLAKLDRWTEDAIRERGGRLAAQAASVWPAPSLPADVLDAYKPKAQTAGYSIKDHPHLVAGPSRDVFEAFHKQVLALDPCVTEEFLKLYVAYKAETNFVDVVPQAKRLRLSLNMGVPRDQRSQGDLQGRFRSRQVGKRRCGGRADVAR
jgi:predicted transport protein